MLTTGYTKPTPRNKRPALRRERRVVRRNSAFVGTTTGRVRSDVRAGGDAIEEGDARAWSVGGASQGLF